MANYRLLTQSLLSLLLICSSCSNDEDIREPQSQDKQAVNINITSIEKEFETDIPTNSKASTAIDSCYLWYTIHKKSDGSLVKNRLIEKTDILNFSDTLAQGEYIYSVFASNHTLENKINTDIYSKTYFSSSAFNSDLFYSSFDVKVGNNSINEATILKRLVGKITINIEDPELIPENATVIAVKVNNVPYRFDIQTGLMTYTTFDLTQKNAPYIDFKSRTRLLEAKTNQFELYFLPNTQDFYKGDKQLDIYISLYEEKSPSYIPNLLSDILIKKNVVVKQNVPLILSGKLFPPKSNSSNISINEEWGISIEQPFDNN